MGPRWHHRAAQELNERGGVMATLVDTYGPPDLGRVTPVARRFERLACSIAYQQLAGRAAATIWGRVAEAVGDPFLPDRVLGVGEEVLRGAGLSRAKTASLRDLAVHTLDGRLDFGAMGRMSDEEVEAHLTVVRGIGPWTAHMFLMFELGRPDVWPTGDYGVRSGFARAFSLSEVPTEKELMAAGEDYRPWRSAVAWYMWRVVDTGGRG